MDVKETKEVLIAITKLGKFVAAAAKDGLDVKDLGALAAKFAADESFRNTFIAALDGISKIPAEVKELSFEDGVELALAVIAELKAA